MTRTYIDEQTALAVIKRAFFLAWKACGGPLGMGVFQDQPDAGEDAVWKNVTTDGDYASARWCQPSHPYGDYVFGRMMKFGIKRPTATSIEVRDDAPRGDYQAWCYTYKTYEALIDAAEKEVGAVRAQETAS